MSNTRHIRHALTALTHTTPARRRTIQAAAEEYLSQIDRRRLPVGCNQAILNDRSNRADAYRMRRGNTLARMLGLAAQPADPYLPDVARAVLNAIDAPIRQLTNAAASSGQPLIIAIAWVASAAHRAPKPKVLQTISPQGGLLGYDQYAIAPGAPLPDGRTIATVEDPLGSCWRVTDDQGRVHHLHKYGRLIRYTSGTVVFVEPEWAGWSSD